MLQVNLPKSTRMLPDDPRVSEDRTVLLRFPGHVRTLTVVQYRVWWSSWLQRISARCRRIGGAAALLVLCTAAAIPLDAAPATGTTGANGIAGVASDVLAATPTRVPEDPRFTDLVVDDARGRLYAAERRGSTIAVFSLADRQQIAVVDVGGAPRGLDLSPDGRELAVAVPGTSSIVFIDLDRLAVDGRVQPDISGFGNGPYSPNRPVDVVYGRDTHSGATGRLYSVGDTNAHGADFLHVFDTATRTEVGRSRESVRMAPRLFFVPADPDQPTIYVVEAGHHLRRFTVSTDTPQLDSTGLFGTTSPAALTPVVPPHTTAGDHGSRPDDVPGHATQIVTTLGEVWSADLRTRIATFGVTGREIVAVPARQRLFVSDGFAVKEIDTTDYTVVGQRTLSRGRLYT